MRATWAGATATVLCLLTAGAPALAQTCDMARIKQHGDAQRTSIYAASTGVASLYFRADMDVNTDGSPRSYHPDDPRGERLAFNNIANGIGRIRDALGVDITCSPRRGACFTRFITTFEASRDAGYDPVGHPRFTTPGIIPWKFNPALGRSAPCTIASGPFKGYFVSQTALAADPSRDACDQARYLDSQAFNANVLPGGAVWKSQGVATDGGDLVVAHDLETGRTAFAINGDAGPAASIGEGSIALTAALKGVTLTGDEPYAQIRALARPRVQYVIFPRDDIRRLAGPTFTQADIDRHGAALFTRWGGPARLAACASLN